MLKTFFEEMKARNVRKTLAIYVGSALSTIGIIKLFVETYSLTTSILPVIVTILTCGIGNALTFAWYHGKEGAQKFTGKELLLHSLIGVVAIALSFTVGKPSAYPTLSSNAKTIAVLPFENKSGREEDEYFSDGITEDILTQLAKINDLRVIAHATAKKYKDTKKTAQEIGKELGVAAILTGEVRRDGARIRISGRLISTASNEYIWAERYDREFTNIFSIQSDVARHIAEGLRAQMTSDEVKRVNAPPTTNLEAYALYLRGRDHINKGTAEDNNIAIDLFQRAIGLDARYALAYAELGLAYRQRYIAYGYPRVWADSAVALGRRASELDPTSAVGYHTMGTGYRAIGKLNMALQSYDKAIQLSPNHAQAISGVGWVAFNLGKLDEALSWMQKSVELAPDDANLYVNVALVINLLGKDSLAVQWFNKSLELKPEILPTTYYHLTYLFLFQRKIAEARTYAHTAYQKSPNDIWTLIACGDVELMAGNLSRAREYYERCVQLSSLEDGPGNQLAFALQKLGETTRATVILDSSLAIFKRLSNENPEDSYNPFVVATNYAVRNNREEAISWLRIALELGYAEYRWLCVEPMIDNLRTHPDFQLIMNTLQGRLKEMHSRAEKQGLFRLWQ